MYRKLAVLGIITLSSYSLADPIPANLRDFKASDICEEPLIEVSIDGRTDKVLQDGVIAQIIRQDRLFETKFFQSENDCNTLFRMYFNILTVENAAGTLIGYAYSLDLEIQPLLANKMTDMLNREFRVAAPIIYDNGSIGATGPLRSQLEAVVINSAEARFQDFVIDWRKFH
ncbi:hypothetical protein L1280_003159 [Deinococcus sp. HSC-46F16]|uniref:hypothetical protein n=1 Tax=Deinococcus sp. HSC-46F16 TaxID=2910968 RepID=UPI00209FE0B2|nr:hypothetical protein [Deinococcus sp. HSC-46F16]MCP2015972.1 hypothetical protein [Deinococcus sp. HSC-46F16]